MLEEMVAEADKVAARSTMSDTFMGIGDREGYRGADHELLPFRGWAISLKEHGQPDMLGLLGYRGNPPHHPVSLDALDRGRRPGAAPGIYMCIGEGHFS